MRELTASERLASAAQAAMRRKAASRHERLPAAIMHRHTLSRLRRLVDHAYETVPFYRDLYRAAGYEPGAIRSLEDFGCLPVVSKALLRAQPRDRLLSSRVSDKRLLPSITSGSSGEQLTVWHDASRLGRLGLAVLRVTAMNVPHRPWDRTLYVYTSRFPIRSVFGFYPFYFVPTTAPPSTIASVWRSVRPAVVWVYPSRLRDLLDELGQLPEARLVSVGSEMSSAAERRRWEEQLRTPVRDQYATEELGLVAAECSFRSRHVFSDLCFVEILDQDGGAAAPGSVGDLIGTNLENRAMPIIRYRQGDRGAIHGQLCPCGRTLPVLDPVEGRARVDLRTPDGRRVGSGVVIDTLYGLVLDLGLRLDGYQLVGGDPTVLYLMGSLSAGEIAAGARYVESRTGLVVRPQLVDQLPTGPGGKREVIRVGLSEADGGVVGEVNGRPQDGIGSEQGWSS